MNIKIKLKKYKKKTFLKDFEALSLLSYDNFLANSSFDRVQKIISKYELFKMSQNIPGDIVECGVWKGGNLILCQKYLNLQNVSIKIHGFDNFEGMVKPKEIDADYRNVPASEMHSLFKKDKNKNSWAYCSLEDVNKNIKETVPKHNIKLIKGIVEKTLLDQKNLPEKISILRLDTDFYESTKIELEILYPKLVSGGFLIIDDYGHFKGCRKAVDEYFRDDLPYLHYVDYSCRLIIKS